MAASLLEQAVAAHGVEAVAAALGATPPHVLRSTWELVARPDQLEPPGRFRTWLFQGGRGAGKTRTGAEWIRKMAMEHPGCQVALMAPTVADARDVMVQALLTPWKGGMLRPEQIPCYEPSKRLVSWPNGSRALTFSADTPDSGRGYFFHFAWCDEVAMWRYYDSWTNLQFALREGEHARAICTTTPKPRNASQVFAAILDAPSTVITRAKTSDNIRNLDANTVRELEERYGGTRLGRQELEGEIVEGVEGALWTPEMIDRSRVQAFHAHDLVRTVIGVDPATTSGENSDKTGIVVCAKSHDGHAFVLADWSCKLSPDGWGRRVVQAYRRFNADRIVCETNQGGDAWKTIIHGIDPTIAFRGRNARRNKIDRAEPVAALYEQNVVHHVGMFKELEDELTQYTPDGYTGSPDRADAMVWAIGELMFQHVTVPDDDLPLSGGRRRE